MATPRKIRNCACGREMEPRQRVQCKLCAAHDPHSNRSRAAKRPQEMFVSVDCEGVQVGDIMHKVSVSYGREDGSCGSLTAPDGEYLDGAEVLNWLLDNVSGHYADSAGQTWKQVPVSFFFGWDTAVILKDFTRPLLLVHKSTAKARGLLCWTNHATEEEREGCNQFHRDDQALCQEVLTDGGEGDILAWDAQSLLAIASSPKRRFYAEHRPHGDRFEGNRRLDIHDTGAAFTGGLLQTIDDYDPPLSEAQREAITWGKAARKDGFLGGSRTQVEAYSEAECVAHARCCRIKLDRLLAATKIPMKPSHLFGSGSIASAAFKFHMVPPREDTHQEDALVDGMRVDDLAQMTYFGGMIETPVLGILDQAVDEVDINSAYPSHMVNLPCMVAGHGHWEHRKGVRCQEAPQGGVGHVRASWAVTTPSTGPFIVRRTDSRVAQPLVGRSVWVTLPEFQTATAQFGAAIVPHEVVWWAQTCECPNPLEFLADLYTIRQEMKTRLKGLDPEGHEYAQVYGEQNEVKLVINSAYGKTAQRRPTFGRFTNLHWASYITGCTRAQVRRETWEREAQGGTVVYQHTDSVLSIGGTPTDGGKALGAWGMEHQSFTLAIVQPGLAVALDGGKVASRGCSKADFEAAVRVWEKTNDFTRPPTDWEPLVIERTMMVSRRMAIARGKPEMAGTFEHGTLRASFRSNKRRIVEAVPLQGNPRAWSVPPAEFVHDAATLQDLKSYMTELQRREALGEMDWTPL